MSVLWRKKPPPNVMCKTYHTTKVSIICKSSRPFASHPIASTCANLAATVQRAQFPAALNVSSSQNIHANWFHTNVKWNSNMSAKFYILLRPAFRYQQLRLRAPSFAAPRAATFSSVIWKFKCTADLGRKPYNAVLYCGIPHIALHTYITSDGTRSFTCLTLQNYMT